MGAPVITAVVERTSVSYVEASLVDGGAGHRPREVPLLECRGLSSLEAELAPVRSPLHTSDEDCREYWAVMLDTFEILTTSGIVLWSKSYANVSANIVNSLITDVYIEERGVAGASADDSASVKPTYRKDNYTLKWTTVRDLGNGC